jgi:dipeptidyl aminopeptidase/acylaminoacyl peptidase
VAAELTRTLLQASVTLLADVAPAADGSARLLLRCDLSGTMQVHEAQLAPDGSSGRFDGVAIPDTEPAGRPLTALPEPVGRARYVPGRREAILEIDAGGNERHGLYGLDLEAAGGRPARELGSLRVIAADPDHGHHLAGISPDGRQLAFLSNRANGIDFDLWLGDLISGESRLVWSSGAYCQPAGGFSPDGRVVSLLRPGERPLDHDLVLVDVASGDVRVVLPHPAEPGRVDHPAWLSDGRLLVASDAGRDLAAAVCLAPAAQTGDELPATGERGDAAPFASPDGRRVLIVENVGGRSVMHLRDSQRLEIPEPAIPLPAAGVALDHVIGPPRLSPGGDRVLFSLSAPRLPGDVFVYDRASRRTRRLTHSPGAPVPDELVEPEVTSTASFDGETIPLFVYRPPGVAAAPPVVVIIHGGPEAQATLSFSPIVQALALSGFAVVVPNVRGSTGYGRRYASLDDGRRRLDSVRDLAAVHEFLGPAGLDAARAALWGGSYGGYMVLAGLAFQPQRWAAGVDIVGISDLVTFLEHTSAYRRRHREHEYGSLEHDRDFLAEASPLRRAADIRAPLFVIHGRNDPRVPVGEAEQLVAELRGREVPCELAIYEDEGHGLARLKNRLDAYPRAIGFLERVLAPAAEPSP